MVERTRLNVTSHVHCLSGYKFNPVFHTLKKNQLYGEYEISDENIPTWEEEYTWGWRKNE